MKFIKRDNYHATSECGRFVINRANLLGGGAYQAVRFGSPSEILATERYSDDDKASRVDAYNKCVAACEAEA